MHARSMVILLLQCKFIWNKSLFHERTWIKVVHYSIILYILRLLFIFDLNDSV